MAATSGQNRASQPMVIELCVIPLFNIISMRGIHFWCYFGDWRSSWGQKVKFKFYFYTELVQILVSWIYHFMCIGLVPSMRFLNIMNRIAMIKEQLEVKVICLGWSPRSSEVNLWPDMHKNIMFSIILIKFSYNGRYFWIYDLELVSRSFRESWSTWCQNQGHMRTFGIQ